MYDIIHHEREDMGSIHAILYLRHYFSNVYSVSMCTPLYDRRRRVEERAGVIVLAA